jgi:hypothetical protein
MAELSISLSNIQNIKTVNIEEIGVFKVRKLGAGEELDLSIKMRRLVAIAKELKTLDISNIDASTPEGLARFNEHSEIIDKYSEEIANIKKYEIEIYKGCFTDDGNGEKVDFLINGLTDDERGELFKRIFDIPKIIDTPEALVLPVEPKDKNNE